MRRASRGLLPLLVALVALVIPVTASAHAVLVQSFPAHGQRLDKAPPWVEIQFNEPVTAAFTPLIVRDEQGRRVDLGDARIDPQDPTRVSVNLKSLPDGLYTAVYRVTSLDGHPVEGTIAFAVGDVELSVAGGPEAQAVPRVPASVSLVHGLVQWSAVLITGLTLFFLLVPMPAAPALPLRPGRWAVGLSLLLLGFGLIEVSLYAVRASGEPWSPSVLFQALTATRFGQTWLLRAGLALLGSFCLARADRPSPPPVRALLALPGLGLLLTLSLQSHAMATSRLLAVLADWLHLVAVAPWVGGLAAFVLVIGPALRSRPAAEGGQILRRLVPRFSRVAVLSVILLGLTGTYGALLHVPGWGAVWTTAYGRALGLKLLLLIPVLALAAYNRASRGQGWFRLAAGLELLLVFAIFVTTGFLTSLMPARAEIALRQGPMEEAVQVEGYTIGLKITPNRLGFNRAEIRLTGPDGQPVTGASAGLRVTMPEHEMGLQNPDAREEAPGVYSVDDVILGMPGEWRIEVVFLTRGGREVRHPFKVVVPDPPR